MTQQLSWDNKFVSGAFRYQASVTYSFITRTSMLYLHDYTELLWHMHNDIALLYDDSDVFSSMRILR